MVPTRLLRVTLPAIAIGLVIMVLYTAMKDSPRWFADAFTYLAAAQRLNDGNELYALSPSDRFVELRPPYWTVPLLSPPAIAVVWRPLWAWFGEGAVVIWAGVTIATWLAVLGVLISRKPMAAGVAIAVLSLPIAFEIFVGNVNGLLLGGAALVWIWRDRDRAAVILAAMIAVKLAPVVLATVFLRRPRSLVVLAAALAVAGAFSVAGAGLESHVTYLSIARAVHPSEMSLPSITGISWLHTAVLVGGTAAAAVATLAGRRALGYRLAVIAMIFGSPVVNANTLSLLVLLLIPSAFPEADPAQPSTATTSRERRAAAPSLRDSSARITRRS